MKRLMCNQSAHRRGLGRAIGGLPSEKSFRSMAATNGLCTQITHEPSSPLLIAVEFPSSLTAEHQALVLRYLGEAERFSLAEWMTLLSPGMHGLQDFSHGTRRSRACRIAPGAETEGPCGCDS